MRTQSRVLVLGELTFQVYEDSWDMYNSSAEQPQTRLRNQMKRLFNVAPSQLDL